MLSFPVDACVFSINEVVCPKPPVGLCREISPDIVVEIVEFILFRELEAYFCTYGISIFNLLRTSSVTYSSSMAIVCIMMSFSWSRMILLNRSITDCRFMMPALSSACSCPMLSMFSYPSLNLSLLFWILSKFLWLMENDILFCINGEKYKIMRIRTAEAS